MSNRFTFSVVVPTYNRPKALGRLLEALGEQDFPAGEFEVILVDDGSDPPIQPAARSFGDGLNLAVLRQANLGPAAARNHGAGLAKGRYLVFTDDDCRPDPGWLSALYKALRTNPHTICGGPLADGPGGNLYSAAAQLLLDYNYKSYSPCDESGGFYTSNNLAILAKDFKRLGGFDPGMRNAEDRELCYRWACSHGGFAYAPEALVRHYHRLGPATFCKLHFKYGLGTARFRAISAQKGQPRVRTSSVKWYLGLLLHGVRSHTGLRGAALSCLLLMSQAAYFSGVLVGILKSGSSRPA
jgi:glycosyltransferase involved in cell wall biosynthesis